LHPSKFDAGTILDQTTQPGVEIPNRNIITDLELTKFLAPIGARMLVNAIRNRLYIPPYRAIAASEQEAGLLSLAPKITSSHYMINCETMTRAMIFRRVRALGPLYTLAKMDEQGTTLRIKLLEDMRNPIKDDMLQSVQEYIADIPTGVPFAVLRTQENVHECENPLVVKVMADKDWYPCLVIPTITIPSKKPGPAARAAANAKLFRHEIAAGDFNIYLFAHPLCTS
jgi:methionyl-tRNA formyltransferase